MLRCADAVSGNLIWERRNVPTSFLLQGDEEYVLAVAKSDPNDPSGLVLAHRHRRRNPFRLFQHSPVRFQMSGRGRRVLMTNAGPIQLTLSMMEIAPRPQNRLEQELSHAGLDDGRR